jgi:hypothetical protein
LALPQQEVPLAEFAGSQNIDPSENDFAHRKVRDAAFCRDRLQETQGVAQVMALEQIRRMRGGSQAQLMRCSDGSYYVVKFQNNPQGTAILASDLLGTLLAIHLRLPTQPPAIVNVGRDLIAATECMTIQREKGNQRCRAGLCFGSLFPCSTRSPHRSPLAVVDDLLPNDTMRQVDNIAEYAGMLVFDQWTCNTDGRQTIFVGQGAGTSRPSFHASMIDQGACFNGAQWNFPDAPLRGLYRNRSAYQAYRGFEVFEPWLGRLEQGTDGKILNLAGKQIPLEWFGSDTDALERLLQTLDRRRKRVRDLLWSVLKSSPGSFPHWEGSFLPPGCSAPSIKYGQPRRSTESGDNHL